MYFDTSIPQHRYTSIWRSLNTSLPQCWDRSSTRRYFNSVVPQRPSDARLEWRRGGERAGARVAQQALPLPGGRLHLLGWLSDAVARSTAYECALVARAGRDASRVLITVRHAGRRAARRVTAISEHDKMMQHWKKTWESCTKKNTL
uniref:Uncharacterized protein n=1 Tax=Nothoprocta perdicaria TaxID=30464 RepID=A0A8C6Z8S0_NOTPE